MHLVWLREIAKTGTLHSEALSCIKIQMFLLSLRVFQQNLGLQYNLSGSVTSPDCLLPAPWNTCSCAFGCSAVTHVTVTIPSLTVQLVYANSAWTIKNTTQKSC